MDLYGRLDELSSRLNRLTTIRHSPSTSILPVQQVCAVCSSPTHLITECPELHQFPGYMYEQVHQDQTQTTYRLGNNTYFDAYNQGWRNQIKFSQYPDIGEPRFNQSWPNPIINDQPSFNDNEEEYSFLERTLEVLAKSNADTNDTLNSFMQTTSQILTAQTQSIARLEMQLGQLAMAVNDEELPSQPETDPDGPYLNENFNVPEISKEELIIPLGNQIEQPCIIENTIDNSTKANICEDELKRRDELLPSSPDLPMTPCPSTLDLSNPLNGKGEQLGVVMEPIETSQELQVHNMIEEATHEIPSKNSLNPYLAHLEVDDLNIDGYAVQISDPVRTPYSKPTPLLIERYEPSASPPRAPLLESPTVLELNPLSDAHTDILPVIPSQEVQLLGVLNAHKEAIGWDIMNMRDNEFQIFITDFSNFGTTFEDCLQTLSVILKRCMETELILIWKKCQVTDQKGIMPTLESGIGLDMDKIEEIFKLPPLAQQIPSLLDFYVLQFWCNKLDIITLLNRANRRRVLHGRFSAMMTRPPDWPCPFQPVRDTSKFIMNKTLS